MLGPLRNSAQAEGTAAAGDLRSGGECCPMWLERGSQAASGKRGGLPCDPSACCKGVKSQSLQGHGPKQPGSSAGGSA